MVAAHSPATPKPRITAPEAMLTIRNAWGGRRPRRAATSAVSTHHHANDPARTPTTKSAAAENPEYAGTAGPESQPGRAVGERAPDAKRAHRPNRHRDGHADREADEKCADYRLSRTRS